MGIEIVQYAIPSNQPLRPTREQIGEFAQALIKQKWVDDDSEEMTVGNDDIWTNAPRTIGGGATSCFALAVNLGKSLNCYWKVRDLQLHPDLHKLLESHFGCKFYEVTDAC